MNRIVKLLLILVAIITLGVLGFSANKIFGREHFALYNGLNVAGAYEGTCKDCTVTYKSGVPSLSCTCKNKKLEDKKTTFQLPVVVNGVSGLNNCDGVLQTTGCPK
jgi:hypothetical protein